MYRFYNTLYTVIYAVAQVLVWQLKVLCEVRQLDLKDQTVVFRPSFVAYLGIR
jgi:hypothetical protein